MKKIILLGLMGLSLYVFSQSSWTLDSCLSRALMGNPRLEALRFQALRDSAGWQKSRAERWPLAEFSGGEGLQLGDTYNVSTGVGQRKSSYTSFTFSVQASLFEGGTRRNLIRYRDALRKAGWQNYRAQAWEISSQVIVYYYKILFDRANLELTGELIDIQSAITRIAETLYRRHLKPYDDYLSARADEERLRRQREDVLKQYRLDQMQLSQLLDLDTPVIDVVPPSGAFIIPDTVPFRPAMLPQIQNLRHRAKALNYLEKAEKGKRWPRFYLRYSYGSSYYHLLGQEDRIYNYQTGQWEPFGIWKQLRSNQMHYLFAGIRIPLFQGFRIKREVEIARYERQAVEAELKARQREIQTLYRQWLTEARSAHRQWETQRHIAELARQTLIRKEQQYRQNTIPYIEWQKARENYLRARILLSRYRWETYMKYELLKRLFEPGNL